MGMAIGMSDRTAVRGFGPVDPDGTQEAARSQRGRRRWGLRVAAGLAAGAGLVVIAALGSAPTSGPSSASIPAAAAPGGEVVDATLAPAFALATSEGAHARYEARVDAASGERRDGLSVGALEGDSAALRIEMWRGKGARPAAGLFVEIAEQSAEFGAAIERLGAVQRLTTSQGPVDWAELTLAVAKGRRNCVGFRLAPRVEGGLHGVACAAAGAKIDAAGLGCLLDRLVVTRAGREAGFGDIVRGADDRRSACRAAVG
ncbi:MAG: hypothetical protein ABR863_06230 [Roseiarcus sp.]|jgi:hypothetical protein